MELSFHLLALSVAVDHDSSQCLGPRCTCRLQCCHDFVSPFNARRGVWTAAILGPDRVPAKSTKGHCVSAHPWSRSEPAPAVPPASRLHSEGSECADSSNQRSASCVTWWIQCFRRTTGFVPLTSRQVLTFACVSGRDYRQWKMPAKSGCLEGNAEARR